VWLSERALASLSAGVMHSGLLLAMLLAYIRSANSFSAAGVWKLLLLVIHHKLTACNTVLLLTLLVVANSSSTSKECCLAKS
jgi:hypothetical protein